MKYLIKLQCWLLRCRYKYMTTEYTNGSGSYRPNLMGTSCKIQGIYYTYIGKNQMIPAKKQTGYNF